MKKLIIYQKIALFIGLISALRIGLKPVATGEETSLAIVIMMLVFVLCVTMHNTKEHNDESK